MTDNTPAPILPEFPPKANFRAWLRSLPPDQVVAENWSCFTCPLAQWLTAKGLDIPYVRPDEKVAESAWRVIGFNASPQPLPEWANEFAFQIDEISQGNKPSGEPSYGAVTAADCLAVLRGMPRG